MIVCTLDKVTEPFKEALPNICFLKNPCSSTISSFCRKSCPDFHQVLASLWFRMCRLYKKNKNSIVAGDMSLKSVYDYLQIKLLGSLMQFFVFCIRQIMLIFVCGF